MRQSARSRFIEVAEASSPRVRETRESNQLSTMVGAAGVGPAIGVENTQLIDSEIAGIGMISRITKSTLLSLYSLYPELLQLPKFDL